jgi:hypothetical protein
MFSLGMHHAVMLAGGWVLFAIGMIGAPLPFHPGLPLLALGGLMLVGRSPRFRRWAARLRACIPEGSAKLTEKSRRLPRPLRYLILRTDPRRVLGRNYTPPRARGWAFR